MAFLVLAYDSWGTFGTLQLLYHNKCFEVCEDIAQQLGRMRDVSRS